MANPPPITIRAFCAWGEAEDVVIEAKALNGDTATFHGMTACEARTLASELLVAANLADEYMAEWLAAGRAPKETAPLF